MFKSGLNVYLVLAKAHVINFNPAQATGFQHPSEEITFYSKYSEAIQMINWLFLVF